jgi:hypothetical protein
MCAVPFTSSHDFGWSLMLSSVGCEGGKARNRLERRDGIIKERAFGNRCHAPYRGVRALAGALNNCRERPP